MSTKAEKDVVGAVGLLASLFGADNPAVAAVADMVMSKHASMQTPTPEESTAKTRATVPDGIENAAPRASTGVGSFYCVFGADGCYTGFACSSPQQAFSEQEKVAPGGSVRKLAASEIPESP